MNPSSTLTRRAVLWCGAFIASNALAVAALQLASPFGDHMVLQRDQPVPVWGSAEPGETVVIEFGGKKETVTADASGHWRADLPALSASTEPREFAISGSKGESKKFSDVLVGEVWLCSGQSNMERQLGLRPGQKPIVDWEREVAEAKHPLIRQLYVEQHTSITPLSVAPMSWTVCSPETVTNFTAVGYFFARDLQAKLGVPVGIIHSSWGGTPAEAWTSIDGLRQFPEFGATLESLRLAQSDPASAARQHTEALAGWYARMDPGSQAGSWSSPNLDTAGWEAMDLPAAWEEKGHDGFDGIVWFRRTFDLPAEWKGEDVELRLGPIDDDDTTWVNGTLVGAIELWNKPRVYRVPGSALKQRGNVVAVRVLDTGGFGGIYDHNAKLAIISPAEKFAPVSLEGAWQCKFAAPLDNNNFPPLDLSQGANGPTVLYNGMIAPLPPYAIKGVCFYQGEANAGRTRQYQALLPALITDWRHQWSEGDFPFLFVQIAPYKGQPPEIREAQLIAWQNTRNTSMIVTIDCGDADDIHPAHKQPVGARLALAARALAYGEKIEYSGPVFDHATFNEGHAVLSFTHVDGGLVAKDGALTGFTVAGVDGTFHAAKAEIQGDTVVVASPEVPQPTSVRYGWANVAAGNLFNQVGLPASPFRTDVPR
jgi:sialate O-acetylesterase